MIGFHSVIDKPDKVSRVIPPTTTITKISPQQINSHAATAPCRVLSVSAFAEPGRLANVENDNLRAPAQSAAVSIGWEARATAQVARRDRRLGTTRAPS
jgi:hypothetical protein